MHIWLMAGEIAMVILLLIVIYQNRRINKQMADQEQELKDALASLTKAIADAADRVTAKLDALAINHPDLSSEIAEVQADVAALGNIAPADKSNDVVSTGDAGGTTEASGDAASSAASPSGDGE